MAQIFRLALLFSTIELLAAGAVAADDLGEARGAFKALLAHNMRILQHVFRELREFSVVNC